MGEISYLHNTTSLDIPPDRVLESAIGNLTECLVIGWDNDGQLYLASSTTCGPDVLWLIEKAKIEFFRLTGGQ